jgi:hypothetical protein
MGQSQLAGPPVGARRQRRPDLQAQVVSAALAVALAQRQQEAA